MISLTSSLVIFVVLWVLTFPLAWYLLARLAFLSINKSVTNRKLYFLVTLTVYMAIILLPYVPLLLADIESNIFQTLLYAVVLVSVAISLVNMAGYKRVIKRLWSSYAHFYDGLLLLYPYRNLLDKVEQKLDLRGNLKLLDLGCGTGNLETKILSTFPKVSILAVDPTSEMLGKARKKLATFIEEGRVNLHESEMETFIKSQPSDGFDRIVLVNSLYTQERRDIIWKECLRILKPDGLIVVANPDRKGSASIIREHLQSDSFLKLLHPKFIIIGIIDHFISLLSDSDAFHFPSYEEIKEEVRNAGGVISPDYERCYGGTMEGVNVLFTISKLNRRKKIGLIC